MRRREETDGTEMMGRWLMLLCAVAVAVIYFADWRGPWAGIMVCFCLFLLIIDDFAN